MMEGKIELEVDCCSCGSSGWLGRMNQVGRMVSDGEM